MSEDKGGQPSCVYDGNGNETGSSNGLAFTYNAKNQTTASTGLVGTPLTAISYADAGQGERTSTTTGGVTTNYLNSALGLSGQTTGGRRRTTRGHRGGTW